MQLPCHRWNKLKTQASEVLLHQASLRLGLVPEPDPKYSPSGRAKNLTIPPTHKIDSRVNNIIMQVCQLNLF